MRRHRRRALYITFLRQFASASSSARATAITGRGMDFMVHAGSTAATLTGAGTVITGINQDLFPWERPQVCSAVSTVRLLRFRFDSRKSRLLQLLIQRGKIGLQ